MRDLLRHDRVVANLRGELYPEIAAVWGLAFAIFLEWEGARLQPEEIRLGVIVTIVGVFLTRIVAIVRGRERMVVRLNVSPVLMTKGRIPRRQSTTSCPGFSDAVSAARAG
jgi:hypothetical protein